VYGDAVNVIAYTRVSTDEQAESGLGLDAQRSTIAAAAAGKGWTVTAEYTDNGRSGKDINRPALLDAMNYLDTNGGALVVAKLDRLSRSVLDFAQIAVRARRHGWAVVALDVDVDTTTPTGELVANITASVAQWERRIISARTSEALQAKKAAGCRLGRPVTLNAEIRTRIITNHAAGNSLAEIARTLNAENIPTARGGTWYPSTIKGVLASVRLDDLATELVSA
jgi:DNA invertase Pin-like site-specific DNA recombinase